MTAVPGDACGRGAAAEFDAADLRRFAIVEAATDKLLGAALHRPARGYPAIGGEGLYQDYGQFWGMRSGSGLVLGSGHGLAVAEADTANDLGEGVGAVQPAPVALG